MEIADVRKRVTASIDRAKRRAAERRARADQASGAYARFLDQVAVPVFRQVENVLRVEGYSFKLFTPGGSVRLEWERAADNYIELAYDGAADPPAVVGRTRFSRGRRTQDREIVVGEPETLSEEDVLTFVLDQLEPLVER
jgi:hypothetical protein